MDGSAAPFVFLIECAGIVEQPAPRRAIQLLHRLSVDGGDGRVVSLTPAPGFSASFEIDFDNAAIAHQEYVISVHPSTFKAEIARARTFGFAHEIDGLRAAGLARGGSLDNAVVISGNRILNRDGLRYDDEFVRHKILDGVGDLYLAGAPLLGHFHGLRSGHSLNHHLLRTLFARPKAWRYVELAGERLAAPAAAHPALGAYPAAGD
jgi:UDP-3-O-[3-hydroxymyristoyl] N-acetylglucosamine deacetylase